MVISFKYECAAQPALLILARPQDEVRLMCETGREYPRHNLIAAQVQPFALAVKDMGNAMLKVKVESTF